MHLFSWLWKRKDEQHDDTTVTRLSRAIRSGEMKEIKDLLRSGVRADTPDGSGRLPICLAAETGSAYALELLLGHANPNVLDHGRPPLFFSAARLHQDCIKLLIEAGADANLVSTRHKYMNRDFSELGLTPLHAVMLAYSPKSPNTMDRWIPEGNKNSGDVQQRKLACIELLLQAGSNPAIQNDRGVSPLELAQKQERELLSKYAEMCRSDCILINPHRGWPVFVASRLKAAGLVVFGIRSEEPIDDWKYELLEKCGPRTVILAEGDELGGVRGRWLSKSLLDLRHDLKPGISEFRTLENSWNSVCRHLDLPGNQEDCLFGLRNKSKVFDLFISYKSQDVRAARKLAESLTQLGLRVWMAEYEVLLTGQSAFQVAINEGLASSKRAAIFTNSRFADSAYCQMEVLLALQLIWHSDILEIRVPDERHRFSSLFQERLIRGLDWDDNKPNQSVTAVCKLLNLPNTTTGRGSATDQVGSSQRVLAYRDICVHLQPGMWRTQPSELNLWENRSTTVAEFTMPSTGASLTGRLMIMDAGFGIPVTENGTPEFQISVEDDRELALITRRSFANHHRFTPQFECRGVHIWNWKGLMMPAFTWLQAPRLSDPGEFSGMAIESSWDLIRQYSLFVSHPVSGRPLECRFLFTLRNSSDDMNEFFNRFLEHSEQMEQIVSSIDLSQQRAKTTSDSPRSRQLVERAIRRAIALMALVQRSYYEEEYAAADVSGRRKLKKRRRPVEAWIEKDKIEHFLAPRERKHLSEPLGSWSPFLRMTIKYRQAQIPVLLWYAGIEPRPAIATHPLADIYRKTLFTVPDGWRQLVDKAMASTAPSCDSLSDFSVACIMATARLRSFRLGVKHEPRSIRNAEEILAVHKWKRPLDMSLFRITGTGDLYLALFKRPVEQLSDSECLVAEKYLENQLVACDNLAVPSPGRDFRSQYTADDNLNRILPAFETQCATTWPEEMWI